MNFRAARAPAPAPAGAITVSCLLFGRYAEMVGLECMALTLPSGATAADAVGALRARAPTAAALPACPLIAVNREHVAPEHPLRDGDEVALLPPLAGG